ncbi:MAG: formylmethanofuran dehydrogenase subunit B [Methylohalobius crimeensis]
MAKMIEPGVWAQVPSPFCGIAADDLKIRVVDDGRLEIVENGDSITRAGFEQPVGDARPRIDGKPASLEEAVTRAAEMLKKAELPLVAGLATDVNGMRAALSLADRLGAVVDTMNAGAALRNLLVQQDAGWMTTTLAEVKNRADLIVVAGVDLEARFPRFFERHVWVDGMFVEVKARDIVYLGKAPSGKAAVSPDGRKPQVMACEDADLPAVTAVLRALVKGERVATEKVGGIAVSELAALAERLKNARYGVIAWAAGALDWAYAELTVQTLCETIKELNHTTRCSGLPLGGMEGDQTATQVCGWQTGYPLRLRFSRGCPEYDPYLNDGERLLAEEQADALLWVSAYNAQRTPPVAEVPTIAVGRGGMTFEREPEVYIPVGCPGIDHAGHTYRTDNVVAVRLAKLRDSDLPATARVLGEIERALI